MTNPRVRMVAIIGSMALALSIAAAPAMAQDDPAAYTPDDPRATIQSFMDAVVAKDFEALPSYFCEEQAAQASQFDMASMAGEMPEGFDVQSLLDAFIFDVQIESLETISQDEAEAIVEVVASMSMDIDPAALVPFVEAIIASAGMEADEATIGMFMGMITAEFEAESEDLSGEVTLVPGEAMPWLICSDLDFGADDLMEDDPDAVAADDPDSE